MTVAPGLKQRGSHPQLGHGTHTGHTRSPGQVSSGSGAPTFHLQVKGRMPGSHFMRRVPNRDQDWGWDSSTINHPGTGQGYTAEV